MPFPLQPLPHLAHLELWTDLRLNVDMLRENLGAVPEVLPRPVVRPVTSHRSAWNIEYHVTELHLGSSPLFPLLMRTLGALPFSSIWLQIQKYAGLTTELQQVFYPVPTRSEMDLLDIADAWSTGTIHELFPKMDTAADKVSTVFLQCRKRFCTFPR